MIATRGALLPGDPREKNMRHHDGAGPSNDSDLAVDANCPRGLVLASAQRPLVGEAIVQHLLRHALHPRAVTVTARYVYVLAQWPARVELVAGIAHECKRVAAEALGRAVLNTVWAPGGCYVPLDDPDDIEMTYHQMVELGAHGGWTWTSSDAAKL